MASGHIIRQPMRPIAYAEFRGQKGFEFAAGRRMAWQRPHPAKIVNLSCAGAASVRNQLNGLINEHWHRLGRRRRVQAELGFWPAEISKSQNLRIYSANAAPKNTRLRQACRHVLCRAGAAVAARQVGAAG